MEKIPIGNGEADPVKKHLHIRGENPRIGRTRKFLRETPPHTWRKSDFARQVIKPVGNTSTYVEKILSFCRPTSEPGKHLHIRGENETSFTKIFYFPETPPHTWRKFRTFFCSDSRPGNTSTYVEKILRRLRRRRRVRKHLHIRGENV